MSDFLKYIPKNLLNLPEGVDVEDLSARRDVEERQACDYRMQPELAQWLNEEANYLDSKIANVHIFLHFKTERENGVQFG
jgi:hypothetical protein